MNTPILRKITVTTSWQALSATSEVAKFEISTPPTNAGNVLFRTTDNTSVEVPWVPGEWHELDGVDLNKIEVKGTANDLVTVVGATRTR